ncbi:MAG: GGDEF domain-containing protein [Wenzhouxiangellaceae bacterium]
MSKKWGVQRDLDQIRNQFRTDFQFAMIVLFGALSAAVISAFALYRFLDGSYFGGSVNLMIMASVLLVMLYALRTGQTQRAGYFFAVVTMVACIASTAMFGRTGILWGYVVLWANFLLTSRRFALLINLLMTSALVYQTSLFQAVLEGVTYIVTALLVTTFAWIFAARLERYQRQLELLALQDPLTYAGNRRMMKRDLNAAISDHRRTGRAFALMLIDLDRFKRLNDEQGHDEGDRALRAFADLVRAQIRAEDGFYRFGGEEFVLLLPGHGANSAPEAARSLHRRISGRLQFSGHSVRFSAGVAALNDHEDWPAWLTRADRAMYRAKSEGRDCVRMAESSLAAEQRATHLRLAGNSTCDSQTA